MPFIHEFGQESHLTIEALSKSSSTYKQGIKKNLPIGLQIGVIKRANVQLNIVKQLAIGKKTIYHPQAGYREEITCKQTIIKCRLLVSFAESHLTIGVLSRRPLTTGHRQENQL